jgi:hypothetical protein
MIYVIRTIMNFILRKKIEESMYTVENGRIDTGSNIDGDMNAR